MAESVTTHSHNQLPVEIWHGIFHHLDVPDILRTRRVSRYLNRVSHSRDVWSDAYRKAGFVRPPGPLLSQSAHDLENTLVPSFRVDRNLRRGIMQWKGPAVKRREVWCTGQVLGVSLVFGQLLLIAFSEEVRCYDLRYDAGGGNTIYRSTDGTLKSFHCVSAFDIEGHPFACMVLNEAMQTKRKTSIYLVEVKEHSEVTLGLVHQFEHNTLEINVVNLGSRVIILQGRVGHGLQEDNWHFVAVDVHTHTRFSLPPFTWASWDVPQNTKFTAIEGISTISTSTHLILARSFCAEVTGWSTFFHAFALPPLGTKRRLGPTLTSLSLSHHGVTLGVNVRQVTLLHDSIVDPVTQDALIVIRVHALKPTCPFSSSSRHGVLRLRGAHAHNDVDKVGTITFDLLGPLGQVSRTPFLHASFNGTGRVFYTPEPGAYGTVSALEYKLQVASGDEVEHISRVVEYRSILRFPSCRTLLDYDPYTGRVCLRSNVVKDGGLGIEVLDLAV